MAVTIDKDLLEFNNKMASATGNISSVINNLSSKLDEVNSGASAAASGLSSVYQGTGLSMVQSAFSSISSAVEGIKASFESGPKKAVSMSETLVSEIKKLIELKNEIDELEGKTTENEDKAEDEQNTSDDSKEQLTVKEQEFKTKHESCKAKLSELKGLNPTIDISVKAATPINSGTGEVRAELQNLQEGKPNKVVYTGKNGRTITAYVYLPNGASSIEGLPITLHMGGDYNKADANGALAGVGVGAEIKSGRKYSGIVVILEAENDHSYSDQRYLETAKELADNLVTTYNADSNRISVSGYSYGSYGACHMLDKYPGYFSAAAIVAGGDGSGGGRTKTLVICGDKDPIYRDVSAAYSGRQNNGIIFYTVSGDHGINRYGSSNSIVVNGVEYKNYIEYCLAQTKNS